jgi:hypothetical protein
MLLFKALVNQSCIDAFQIRQHYELFERREVSNVAGFAFIFTPPLRCSKPEQSGIQ